MSPISKLQKYKSSTNTSVLSATTITSCFWQETSSAGATICVYLSPLYSMTVWPSPRKWLAKSLISWCLLLELLKNSSREWRTFIFSSAKTSARRGLYGSRLVVCFTHNRDPWLSLICIYQVLCDRFFILKIRICDLRSLLSETLIQTKILNVGRLHH